MSLYTLDEMLKLIRQWEQRLDSFYDAMQDFLTDKRSRETAQILQKRQKKALDVLNAIPIDAYKNTEYIRRVPDFHSESLVPHLEIDANSTPKDVFETILTYELKLEAYYKHLLDVLVFQKSKDIMAMLLQFKIGQVKDIKNLMDSYDLAL